MYLRLFVLSCLLLAFCTITAEAKEDKGDCVGSGQPCKSKDQCCKGLYCDKHKKKCRKYKNDSHDYYDYYDH
ncbi:hypothetical protein P879_08348 [Paragonimus westermani]|uniref:Uncharacterized protein n=1 Tax=Paragonimus westermani TaxID=34504 RepID=A0A8T0DE39_9TREM|nr:hypothetical protein P879_08348 [Paragonimus westermani]